MQVFVSRPGVEFTLASLVVLTLGVLYLQPAMVAWGGALLLGVVVARGLTLLLVARVRAAGLEMAWAQPVRRARVTRGQPVELLAELRNHDQRAIEVRNLRVLAASSLKVRVEPELAQVPASSAIELRIFVIPERVGRHGVFGLSLELMGQAGLFHVPLSFYNPYGVEVWPDGRAGLRPRLGPTSRSASLALTRRPQHGDSNELRELRQFEPGEPFKRIAWKASARRGKLLVKHFEVEDEPVVWVVVGAALEHAAGPPGRTAFDACLDEAAQLVRSDLLRERWVGLVLLEGKEATWIEPARGPAQQRRLMEGLAAAANWLSPARSAWTSAQVALRAHEHLTGIWPDRARTVSPSRVAELAATATLALRWAPFEPLKIAAPEPNEAALRGYLSAFGITGPARTEPEAPAVAVALNEVLERLARRRTPALVQIVAPLPAAALVGTLAPGLVEARRGQPRLEWCWIGEAEAKAPLEPTARVLWEASELRTRLERVAVQRSLRAGGIRLRRSPMIPPHSDARLAQAAQEPFPLGD
jgi:uncharacterized protein (DUF58 family)